MCRLGTGPPEAIQTAQLPAVHSLTLDMAQEQVYCVLRATLTFTLWTLSCLPSVYVTAEAQLWKCPDSWTLVCLPIHHHNLSCSQRCSLWGFHNSEEGGVKTNWILWFFRVFSIVHCCGVPTHKCSVQSKLPSSAYWKNCEGRKNTEKNMFLSIWLRAINHSWPLAKTNYMER